MKLTEYAILDTEELVTYALTREGAGALEVELAQRLQLALDKIADLEATGSGKHPRG